MFRHCAMFRWVPDTSPDTIAEVAAGLDRLTEIESVRAYHHGPDAGLREGNWDYVVVADFDDVEGYRVYADDAYHQQLIAELIKPNIVDRAAVQFHGG